jgi:hypothetical protein
MESTTGWGRGRAKGHVATRARTSTIPVGGAAVLPTAGVADLPRFDIVPLVNLWWLDGGGGCGGGGGLVRVRGRGDTFAHLRGHPLHI